MNLYESIKNHLNDMQSLKELNEFKNNDTYYLKENKDKIIELLETLPSGEYGMLFTDSSTTPTSRGFMRSKIARLDKIKYNNGVWLIRGSEVSVESIYRKFVDTKDYLYTIEDAEKEYLERKKDNSYTNRTIVNTGEFTGKTISNDTVYPNRKESEEKNNSLQEIREYLTSGSVDLTGWQVEDIQEDYRVYDYFNLIKEGNPLIDVEELVELLSTKFSSPNIEITADYEPGATGTGIIMIMDTTQTERLKKEV